jgi:hypothetical protein
MQYMGSRRGDDCADSFGKFILAAVNPDFFPLGTTNHTFCAELLDEPDDPAFTQLLQRVSRNHLRQLRCIT